MKGCLLLVTNNTSQLWVSVANLCPHPVPPHPSHPGEEEDGEGVVEGPQKEDLGSYKARGSARPPFKSRFSGSPAMKESLIVGVRTGHLKAQRFG